MALILIIDDEQDIREMLSQILIRNGYEVMEASNGKEGLKLLDKHPFDMIITDLIMPEKEGIETIIETKFKFPQLKIIAISGGGRVGPHNYLKIAKSLGAHRVFDKPFDLREIMDAIRELLN